MSLDGRNTLMGIAERVHKNLAFISESHKEGADVHVVTQLLLSLLGLIVFPVETIKENRSDVLQSTLRLSELEEAGWPHWTFTIGQARNLHEFTKRLRNSVAHRRVSFSCDSREIEEVRITFRDRRSSSKTDGWEVQISAPDLKRFVELQTLHDFYRRAECD